MRSRLISLCQWRSKVAFSGSGLHGQASWVLRLLWCYELLDHNFSCETTVAAYRSTGWPEGKDSERLGTGDPRDGPVYPNVFMVCARMEGKKKGGYPTWI